MKKIAKTLIILVYIFFLVAGPWLLYRYSITKDNIQLIIGIFLTGWALRQIYNNYKKK